MVNASKSTILIVDDNEKVLYSLNELFKEDYIVLSAKSGEDAIRIVKENNDIATVVLDIKMPEMDGIETGRLIRKHNPNLPIIFNTGYAGEYEEYLINEREEPFDYIEKGVSSVRLMRSIKNGVESYLLKSGQLDIVMTSQRDYGLIGVSDSMKNVYRTIQKVAPTDKKVMILGETGTGKELVARAIHKFSNRSENKFGIVNCNHKRTELVEAELFGYKKGAFTGAISDKKGLFEVTSSGTIFLDEIGDLSSTSQIALLRVLESGEFQQIGPEADEKKTDVRVICATHRDLHELVDKEIFREDLFYRLKGTVIEMPPLREHKEDIPLMVNSFIDKFTIEKGYPLKVMTQDAMNLLIDYNWPGNVRQLQDVIETVLILSDSELIIPEDLESLISTNHQVVNSNKSLSDKLSELERTFIIKALSESNYNISSAAVLLDIERTNLSKKIKKYKIDISSLKKI